MSRPTFSNCKQHNHPWKSSPFLQSWMTKKFSQNVGNEWDCWPQMLATENIWRSPAANNQSISVYFPSPLGREEVWPGKCKKKTPLHYSHYKWMSFYNHKKLKKCCSTLWFCFFNQCYKISHFLPTGTHSLKRLITEQQKCLISPMDWATHVRY